MSSVATHVAHEFAKFFAAHEMALSASLGVVKIRPEQNLGRLEAIPLAEIIFQSEFGPKYVGTHKYLSPP
jgi:hypothetical protein